MVSIWRRDGGVPGWLTSHVHGPPWRPHVRIHPGEGGGSQDLALALGLVRGSYFLTLSFSLLFLYFSDFSFDFFDFLIFPDAIVLTINFAEEGMGVAFLKTKPLSYPNQISVL